MDARIQKHRMTRWLRRMFVVLAFAASCGAQAVVEVVLPTLGWLKPNLPKALWCSVDGTKGPFSILVDYFAGEGGSLPCNPTYSTLAAAVQANADYINSAAYYNFCISVGCGSIGPGLGYPAAPTPGTAITIISCSEGGLNLDAFCDLTHTYPNGFSFPMRSGILGSQVFPVCCPDPDYIPSIPYVFNKDTFRCVRNVPDQNPTPAQNPTLTLTLVGGTEVEPANGTDIQTLPIIATVKDQNNQPPTTPVAVRISLKVDPTSGGHDHGTSDRPRGGIAGVKTCTSDSECWSHATEGSGAVVFNFNVPAASGKYTISATCDGCSNTATKPVDVKVNDLWPIPGSVYYALTEDGSSQVIGDNGKHAGNHYLTSNASMQLWRLAASFYNFQIMAGVANPTLLHLNDASLKWGGLFDRDSDWDTPHGKHRKGVVIDIRANTTAGNIPESMFSDFEKLADETKLADGETAANAELHCSSGRNPSEDNCVGDINRHYHVLLLGVDQ